MKPLGHNVLISRTPAEDATIVLLNPVERPNTGVVLDVGSKVTEVKEGDKVMFADSFTAKPVPGEDDLMVIAEDMILLIL